MYVTYAKILVHVHVNVPRFYDKLSNLGSIYYLLAPFSSPPPKHTYLHRPFEWKFLNPIEELVMFQRNHCSAESFCLKTCWHCKFQIWKTCACANAPFWSYRFFMKKVIDIYWSNLYINVINKHLYKYIMSTCNCWNTSKFYSQKRQVFSKLLLFKYVKSRVSMFGEWGI